MGEDRRRAKRKAREAKRKEHADMILNQSSAWYKSMGKSTDARLTEEELQSFFKFMYPQADLTEEIMDMLYGEYTKFGGGGALGEETQTENKHLVHISVDHLAVRYDAYLHMRHDIDNLWNAFDKGNDAR